MCSIRVGTPEVAHPAERRVVVLALCVATVCVGLFFWGLGAPLVLPFSGLELLLLCAAFWVHGRQAQDHDLIQLLPTELRVQSVRQGRVATCLVFQRGLVNLTLLPGPGGGVELSQSGRRQRIGHSLPPSERRSLYLYLLRYLNDPASPASAAALAQLRLSRAIRVEDL